MYKSQKNFSVHCSLHLWLLRWFLMNPLYIFTSSWLYWMFHFFFPRFLICWYEFYYYEFSFLFNLFLLSISYFYFYYFSLCLFLAVFSSSLFTVLSHYNFAILFPPLSLYILFHIIPLSFLLPSQTVFYSCLLYSSYHFTLFYVSWHVNDWYLFLL